jgi:hypothetical protein
LSSKQDLLAMLGVHISPQHKKTQKKTMTKNERKFSLQLTPCLIWVPSQMLHGSNLSSAEIPVKHDDIVITQLFLTPFPNNGFPGWLALGGAPMYIGRLN